MWECRAVMSFLWDIVLIASLMGAFLLVAFLIAADKTRYLVSFDLGLWRDKYYLRTLPNFLQALYDRRFKSPWPRKRNAVAAFFYRFRIRGVLRKHPFLARRNFVHHHLTLYALIEQLRPYIQDFFLQDQQRIVQNTLATMEDTLDRDRLVQFVEAARRHRESFIKSLTPYDQCILIHMIDRRFMPTLRTAHAIFQEHGYSLMPEFNTLRRWESLTGAELVQELPEPVFFDIKRYRAIAPIPARNRTAGGGVSGGGTYGFEPPPEPDSPPTFDL